MAVTCCVIIRKVGEEFPKPEVLWGKKKARARYKEIIEEWIDKNKDPKLELELEDLQDDSVCYKTQGNEYIMAIHFMKMEAKPSSLWMVYTYHTQIGLRINNLQGIENEAKAVFFTLCKNLHSTAGYGVGGECDMTEVNHYDGDKGITIACACTVKAKVYMVNSKGETVAYSPGRMVTQDFTMENVVASEPSFEVDIESSRVDAPAFKLSNDYDANRIFYTVDGSKPDEDSAEYVEGESIIVTQACTLKAVAWREGVAASAVVTLEVPNPEEYFATTSLRVEPGWNLLSCPFRVLADSLAGMSGDVAIFSWNGCEKDIAQGLDEGCAYWFFNRANEVHSVEMRGESLKAMPERHAGWNAIGVTRKTTNRSIAANETAWIWVAGDEGHYLLEDKAEYQEGRGYFVENAK